MLFVAEDVKSISDFKGEILGSKTFEQVLVCIVKIRENPYLESLRPLAFRRALTFVDDIKKAKILFCEAVEIKNPIIEEDCWQRFFQFQKKNGRIRTIIRFIIARIPRFTRRKRNS